MAPANNKNLSASVDLPWSICAMMEKLRILECFFILEKRLFIRWINFMILSTVPSTVSPVVEINSDGIRRFFQRPNGAVKIFLVTLFHVSAQLIQVNRFASHERLILYNGAARVPLHRSPHKIYNGRP